MKNFSIITIIILVSLNVLIYYNFISYKKRSNKVLLEKTTEVYKQEKKLEDIKKMTFLQYTMNNINVEKLFSNRYKPVYENNIILFFSKSQCKSCVKKLLQEMHFLKEKSGYNHFVLAGYYNNENIFNAVADSLDNQFKHVFIKRNKGDKEIFKYPTVFAVDNYTDVKLLYVYDYYPDIKYSYFRKILPEFIKNNTIQSSKMNN